MIIVINIISVLLIVPAFYLAVKNMSDTSMELAVQKEQRKRSALNLFPAVVISALSSRIVAYYLLGQEIFLEEAVIKAIVGNGFMISFSYIGMYIVLNIWNRRYDRYYKMSHIWLFLIILLNEIAAVNRMIHMPGIKEEIFMIILQFLVDTGMFLILYNLLMKEKISKELILLHEHMENERIYYQEMDKEREMMAKLRHDYNNQLTSVLGLLRLKEKEEAEKMLKEMRRIHNE